MRVLKKIAGGILIAFVLIQFSPRSVNKTVKILPTDLMNNYPVPVEVRDILKKACYDCHSNNTRYPWYAHVQPIRLMLDRHVQQGKEELNFSEFGSYSKKKQFNKLRSVGKSMEEGTMPLESYLSMHGNAELTNAEKKAILKWVDDTRDLIDRSEE